MLRGFEAFEKHHALAPQTSLRFQLSAEPGVKREGLELRIASDNASVAVALDKELVFDLPRDDALAGDDADLRTNRKRGAVKWFPYIVTPGLPANTRRLGDLRLECLVFWTIGRDDTGILMRMRHAVSGDPCNSITTRWWWDTERPLASAQLREGDRVLPLKLTAGNKGYVVPIRDKKWSDDALVELTYLNSTQP